MEERTRNEIIAFVEQAIHRGGGTPIPEEQEAKWIAWLEKQGEHLSSESINKNIIKIIKYSMSEQEARETACAIFGGNGDFFSFRNKPHNNTVTTTNTTITQPVGFTEAQIKKIIEMANGKSVNFYIYGKEVYFLKTNKIKIEDGLFYAYNKELNAVIIYPLGAIEHIKVFEK